MEQSIEQTYNCISLYRIQLPHNEIVLYQYDMVVYISRMFYDIKSELDIKQSNLIVKPVESCNIHYPMDIVFQIGAKSITAYGTCVNFCGDQTDHR